MAFGSPQPQGGGSGELTYERQDLVFVSQEDKQTQAGKPFWRVKASNGQFYTVWESNVLARMQDLQGANSTPVPCVVELKPNPNSKFPFKTITDCGTAAETVARASNEKAQASKQPGGKLSEFGKRMHPDDALRVTNLALIERALHFLEISIAHDCPEGMSYELYLKGKLMPTMQFLNGVIDLPKTITPDAPATKTEEAPATKAAAGFGDGELTDMDADLPF